MIRAVRILFFSFVTIFLVACGGGGSSGGSSSGGGSDNYCIRNTEHLSKYGTCVQITSLDLGRNYAYVNEERIVVFGYDDEDFVGDMEEFTYEWTFEDLETNEQVVRVQPDFDSALTVTFAHVGKVKITLTVKDQDAVLDTISGTINVLSRPAPILKFKQADYLLEPFGELKLYIGESSNTDKVGQFEGSDTSLDFEAKIISADDESLVGNSKTLSFDSPSDSDFHDSFMSLDLGAGKHVVSIRLIDGHGGVNEQNITVDVPLTSEVVALDQNIVDSKYNFTTDELYVLTENALKVYGTDGALTAHQEVSVASGGKNLRLSNDGTRLLVVTGDKFYLFDALRMNSTPIERTITGMNAKYTADDNVTLGQPTHNSAAVSDAGFVFFTSKATDPDGWDEYGLFSIDMSNGRLGAIAYGYDYLIDSQIEAVANSKLHFWSADSIYEINLDDTYSSEINRTEHVYPELSHAPFSHDVLFGNTYYDIEGKSWTLDGDNPLVGVNYKKQDEDVYYYDSLEKSGNILCISEHKYLYDYSLDAERYILTYDTEAGSYASEFRTNKFFKDAKAYTYDLIYSFVKRNGKRVGIGKLREDSGMAAQYVISIEK